MEITARVTGDAQVKHLKDGRELVAFTIVVNDYYKTKAGEQKNAATFINCSYWMSTKIAPQLTKGSIVTVSGRIDLNVYKRMDGETQANLVFHTNGIRIISKGKATTGVTTTVEDTKDDLPF